MDKDPLQTYKEKKILSYTTKNVFKLKSLCNLNKSRQTTLLNFLNFRHIDKITVLYVSKSQRVVELLFELVQVNMITSLKICYRQTLLSSEV